MAKIDLSGLQKIDTSGLTKTEGGATDDRDSFLPEWMVPTAGKDIDMPDSPLLEAGAKTLVEAAEVLDTPRRAGGKVRSFLDPNADMDMSDPSSTFFKPEIDKIRKSGASMAEASQKEMDKISEKAEKEGRKMSFAENLRYQNQLRAKMQAKAGTEGLALFADEAPTFFLGSGISKAVTGVTNTLKKWYRTAKANAQLKGEQLSTLGKEGFDWFKKTDDAATQLKEVPKLREELKETVQSIVYDRNPIHFPEEQVVKAAVKQQEELGRVVTLERTMGKIDNIIEKTPLKPSNQPVIKRLEKLKEGIGKGKSLEPAEFNIPSKVTQPEIKYGKRTETIDAKPKAETPQEQALRLALGKDPEMVPGSVIVTPERIVQEELRTPGAKYSTKGKKVYEKTMSPKEFRGTLKALDDLIDYTPSGEAKLWNKQLKIVRKAMERDQVKSFYQLPIKDAWAAGKKLSYSQKNLTKEGREALKALKSWHKKLDAVSNLKLKRGQDIDTWIDGLMTANNANKLKMLGELETLMGVKIKEKAKLMKFANKLKESQFIEDPSKPGEFLLEGSLQSENLLPINYKGTGMLKKSQSPEALKRRSLRADKRAAKAERRLSGANIAGQTVGRGIQAGPVVRGLNEDFNPEEEIGITP